MLRAVVGEHLLGVQVRFYILAMSEIYAVHTSYFR